MKRNLFIKNIYKKPIISIWADGSVWWNKEWESGPWYLFKRYSPNKIKVTNDKKYFDELNEYWIMATTKEPNATGRVLDDLNDKIKDEVLKEFEPFRGQETISNQQFYREREEQNG